jgi:hypothetical protein
MSDSILPATSDNSRRSPGRSYVRFGRVHTESPEAGRFFEGGRFLLVPDYLFNWSW